MDALECIFNRRSIRKYESREISPEQVETLLQAAMYAPTASNTQAWHYIVIDKRNLLDKLADIHPYGKMLREATLAILVCGDLNYEDTESYLIQNCSAATQNILLAAHAMGLGTVWLGMHPRKERMQGIVSLFDLPRHIVPISLISIGYPAESKSKPERFNAAKVSYNKV